MSTIIAAGPLIPLDMPVPERRRFDLLSTVDVQAPTSERWLGGAWTEGEIPGPAFTHDPCAWGTERAKMGPGSIATQQSKRFTVYLPGECTTQSIGETPEWFTDKLERTFEVYESSAVERALATGDGHTDIGPFLCDQNLEILNGGDGTSATTAYALLEQAVARHGTGVLHIGLRTFAAWHSFLVVAGDRMRTKLGTPVVIGYGYTGARPDGQPALEDGQEWAFATGPIQVIRGGEIDIVPGLYSEAIDRTVNDALFIAERPYLLNWMARQSETDEDHTQAGVLVDAQGGFEDVIVIDALGNIHIKLGRNLIADLP